MRAAAAYTAVRAGGKPPADPATVAESRGGRRFIAGASKNSRSIDANFVRGVGCTGTSPTLDVGE
jgi:hypothetical protein